MTFRLVDRRRLLETTRLRRFRTESTVDGATGMDLSAQYGVIIHAYATRFAEVAAGLGTAQRAQFTALASALFMPSTVGRYGRHCELVQSREEGKDVAYLVTKFAALK